MKDILPVEMNVNVFMKAEVGATWLRVCIKKIKNKIKITDEPKPLTTCPIKCWSSMCTCKRAVNPISHGLYKTSEDDFLLDIRLSN